MLSVDLCGLETALATFAALVLMDRLIAGPASHPRGAAGAAAFLCASLTGVAAAWNAGVLGYYSGTELVNLDGVINDDALAAVARGRLWDFIRERGVELIVDEPGQIEDNLSRFAGTEAWRDELGPPIHVTEDAEGRRFVARPVLPPARPGP